MSFINTLIIINLVVWVPWLWIYKIHPYFVQRAIKKELKRRPNWPEIHKTERLLKSIFNRNNADRISKKDRKQLGIKSSEFIYGEINFFSFFKILDKAAPQLGEVFYDLGCGSGKAVFASALFYDLAKVRGIELLPGLCTIANRHIQRAKDLLKLANERSSTPYLKRLASIQFINANFLNFNLTDADIVFINATCISRDNWVTVQHDLNQLKAGSRIIVTSKTIEDKQFVMVHHQKELMSWGMCRVSIYKKT